ncbi:hypothetical protein Tco_1192961 [Tanacetum coccineum]
MTWAVTVEACVTRPSGCMVGVVGDTLRPSTRILSACKGLEVSSIRRIQGLDTAYWGFLGVGTTVGIKSLLNAASITTTHIRFNATQLC